MRSTGIGKLALTAVVCAAAAAGCSGGSGARPTSPAHAAFTDGSRLKAVYQRIEGAPPFFLNWYDTLLHVDCAFRDVGLPDQRQVCFPINPVDSSAPTLFANETTYLFTDSACSEPVVNATFAPCAARFFVRQPELGAACGTSLHLFNLGEMLPADPTALYAIDSSGTGPCHPASPSELGGYNELHRLGPEIPLDTLVGAAMFQSGGRGGRVVPLGIVGSDGSFQPESTTLDAAWAAGGVVALDNERNELVSTSLTPGSRWLPTAQYSVGGLFSDPSCSIPSAIGSACGVAAKEAFRWGTDACGSFAPTSWFELGGRVTDQTNVYAPNLNNGTCGRYDAGADSPIVNPMLATFEVGAPVPVTAFAEAREIHTGSGPVQIIQASSGDDSPAASVGFYDTVHGTPCTFQRNIEAADGVVRCLPPTSDPSSPYFADAGCSVPLFQGWAPTTCSPLSAFSSITEGEPSTGGCYDPHFRRRIFRLGDLYTGETYLGAPGTCFDLGTAPEMNLYLLGAEVPASEFEALDEVRPN